MELVTDQLAAQLPTVLDARSIGCDIQPCVCVQSLHLECSSIDGAAM